MRFSRPSVGGQRRLILLTGIKTPKRHVAVASTARHRKDSIMKILRNFAFASLSVASITLLLQIPITRVAAQDDARRGQRHTLRLKANFISFYSTNPNYDSTNPNVLSVGDQFTLGGTVARFESPADAIGDFGVQFVATALAGTDLLAHGALILPDGKISFQMLVGPSDNPDVYAAITGGTGAYLNAGGELIHHTRANADEEFIFNFSTH
jgi:hypothetical protein